MTRTIHPARPLAALAVGALAVVGLSSCGETRYVVVQTPAAAPAGAAAAPSTAAAAPTTVAAAGTTDETDSTAAGDPTESTDSDDAADTTAAPVTVPAGPVAANEDERADIEAALTGALGLDPHPYAERLPFLDGADDLEPTYNAVNDVLKDIDGELRFNDITVTGDTAVAIVDVVVGGADYSTGLPVDLVRVDGAWKVTRAGACTVLSLAGTCPDL